MRNEVAALKAEVRELRKLITQLQTPVPPTESRRVRLAKKTGAAVGTSQQILFQTANLDNRTTQAIYAQELQEPYLIVVEQGGQWFYCPCQPAEAANLCAGCTGGVMPGSVEVDLSVSNNGTPAGGIDWAALLTDTHQFSMEGCSGNAVIDAGSTTTVVPGVIPIGTPMRLVLTLSNSPATPDTGFEWRLNIRREYDSLYGSYPDAPVWVTYDENKGYESVESDPTMDCTIQTALSATEEAATIPDYLTFTSGQINAQPSPPPPTAINLGAGATTFAMDDDFLKVTGDAGGNTIATITGGALKSEVTLLFTDALVTITDDNTHAADSVDLSAAFTSAADAILRLAHDGTSWYEVSRSVN